MCIVQLDNTMVSDFAFETFVCFYYVYCQGNREIVAGKTDAT